MKTLFVDCGMGAAGDMITAALYDLLSDEEKALFIDKIGKLNIENVSFDVTQTEKCGITGSHVKVVINGEEEISEDVHDHSHHHDHDHDHELHHDHDHDHNHNHDHIHDKHHHSHTSYKDICDRVDTFDVSDKVKDDIKSVYNLVAEAESKVHGKPVSDVHFHEVGSLDAIVDISAVSILLEMIGADKIVASPVHVGSGKVRCAHGILPVPAPATAEILKGVPIYGGRIQGELCTPTGAAILKHFVNEFGDMPVMSADKVGYGMGNKDFEVANCVRVIKGELGKDKDVILDLSFNVDDMTPEEIGFATEILLENGARDVFTVPVIMKKSRPGHWIHVICSVSDKDKMVELIMKHTTTIGIRENECARNVLSREIKVIDTPFGSVRVKESSGYGSNKEKAEFDDLAKIAREKGISLFEVKKIISSL